MLDDKKRSLAALIKDKHSLFLGVMEGVKYTEYELLLEPGSRIFVYTDGVPEAMDRKLDMFGMERLIETLNSSPPDTPEQVLGFVRKAVDSCVGDAEQFDDLTMLCMDYRGNRKRR